MRHIYVRKVLRRMGDFSVQVDKDSKAGKLILVAFKGIGQSKIVEDLFQAERVDCNLRNLNTRMSSKRKWHVAFTSDVLEKRHRFRGLAWRAVQLSRDDRGCILCKIPNTRTLSLLL